MDTTCVQRATKAQDNDKQTQELLDSFANCDISEFLESSKKPQDSILDSLADLDVSALLESGETMREVIAHHAGHAEREYFCTPSRLITQKQLAAALSVNVQTVRTWKECPRVYVGKRANGKGSAPRYDLAEVVAWLKDNRRAYQQAEKTWMHTGTNGKGVQE